MMKIKREHIEADKINNNTDKKNKINSCLSQADSATFIACCGFIKGVVQFPCQPQGKPCETLRL